MLLLLDLVVAVVSPLLTRSHLDLVRACVRQSEARANATAVSQFDTVFAVVKASRSLAGKYNIQSNIQSERDTLKSFVRR